MEVFFTRASENIIWAQIRRGAFDMKCYLFLDLRLAAFARDCASISA